VFIIYTTLTNNECYVFMIYMIQAQAMVVSMAVDIQEGVATGVTMAEEDIQGEATGTTTVVVIAVATAAEIEEDTGGATTEVAIVAVLE
jgi:hypothetical protein